MNAGLSLLDEVRGTTPVRRLRGDLAREALAKPWGFPADRALQAASWFADLESPSPPAPGIVAVVTASTNVASSPEQRGRVFVLDPLGQDRFREDAEHAWDLAGQAAERKAPFTCFVRALQAPTPTAKPLYGLGDNVSLEGLSFGLSFALARISALTGHAVPSHIIASANLADADGTLTGVQGLDAKLAAIAHTALGVTDVLVHPSNGAEARAIVAQLPRSLEIIEVESLSQAIPRVFGGRLDQPPSDPIEPSALEDALQALRARTLAGHGLNWPATLRALEWLQSRIAEHPRLRALSSIARRHAGVAGSRGIALDWDDDAIEDIGNEYVAQIVQAAADAGDERCPEYVARARDRVRLAPAEPGSIKALGACARALAMLRRYDDAQVAADEAVRRWLARDELSACSYALCESIRVAGIRRDRGAIARAESIARPLASSPYVRLALAGAWTRAGEFDRALGVAHEPSAAQRYVERAHHRWRALAYDGVENHSTANAIREALRSMRSDRPGEEESVCVESKMADLDAVLAQGGDWRSALEDLERRGLQGTRWIVEGVTGIERAKRLAFEYAY
ncbi:MAG: hypothetical protein Q8Q09_22210 [Deltaproteobacteria bacterium]|nr:hypothetical protein [Deltaproteobacteria bacterium]